MEPEKLLAIAALALLNDKGTVLGMEELDFCSAHDLEQEYFDGEDWKQLFAKNYAAQHCVQGDGAICTCPSRSSGKYVHVCGDCGLPTSPRA